MTLAGHCLGVVWSPPRRLAWKVCTAAVPCLPAVRTQGCHTHGLQGAHRMGLGRSGTWVLFAPLALQALLSPFALDSCS